MSGCTYISPAVLIYLRLYLHIYLRLYLYITSCTYISLAVHIYLRLYLYTTGYTYISLTIFICLHFYTILTQNSTPYFVLQYGEQVLRHTPYSNSSYHTFLQKQLSQIKKSDTITIHTSGKIPQASFSWVEPICENRRKLGPENFPDTLYTSSTWIYM